ncbi:FAS-associated factor 2 [Geosmithia morbida]|uniref:FAS-associated factor 2 n=1 Tax=Geosmithia morbida TaxID=1094350 RepID=A0A9P4YQQ4_9HYPO|nr:FAS-associated factor 2 [Geosmithia morbida]KAF4119876.1 FAS-associated factor 2 [Geosmithia morbida]
MADVDIEQLSPTQREALEQYMQVTNQEVKDAVPLLERSQWNVQIGIAKFFDGEGPDPVAEAMSAREIPRAAARHENLQESLWEAAAQPSRTSRRDRTDAAPRIVPRQPETRRPPWLVGLLLAPFGWGWTAATALFRTVAYILSFLPASVRPRILANSAGARGIRNNSGRRMLMPRDTAARFKREFEEEYGTGENQQHQLPFYEGGIAQAHDQAKKDLKFLLVVLISPEHDETDTFVRETLLDDSVASFIRDPSSNIVLWGGNVLDSEAYQAATEYSCTKFPFSALVCLTPREGSSTRMGIVKRLTGPMPAETYLSELQNAMDKYGGELAAVRADRSAQEVSRSLRTEQDSAYERSLAIDRERARQRKEAAEAAARAERLAAQQAEEAARLEEKRAQWRRWRQGRLLAEPPAGDKDVVRVALMMPGTGRRVVRRFPSDAPLEELYAFVECYGTEEGQAEKPEDGYEHEYRFRISSTLPREVYEPSKEVTMGQKIGRSGNLVVEEAGDDDDDEEDEDEEEDGEDEE